MGNIYLLEKNIAEKIAAGEVVERPLSIVKELVENSIDSGATSVLVEIKKGGKSYIRVTDNGAGIVSEDVTMAFVRHATSKVLYEEDLDSIKTLGFRGEALASISAVSKTEIVTKTRDEKVGTQIQVKGSEVIKSSPVGCPDGTTVVVTDLFYNVPAREKFLKADGAESNLIIDFVTQIALAYPTIKIRMVNNGEILFSTKGNGERLETIVELSSSDFAKNLVPFQSSLTTEANDFYNVLGYVSTMGESRSTRKGQIFFVNGRVVSNKVMERAIDEAYSDKLFQGRYPIAYIFLTVPYDKIDINIHPNKREVRFFEDDLITDFLRDAIKGALSTKFAIPNLEIQKSMDNKNNIFIKEQVELTGGQKTLHDIRKIIKPGLQIDTTLPKREGSEPRSEQINIREVLNNFKDNTQKIAEDLAGYKEESQQGNNEKYKPGLPIDFNELKITGTIFATYITAIDDENFYFIDQHAAHERINYEKLLNVFHSRKADKQPIMVPITLTATYGQMESKDKWIKTLSDFGYAIEDFGPNTFAIKEVPTFFDLSEAEIFANNFLESIDEKTDLEDPLVVEKLAQKACKSSVKANDSLDIKEVENLLSELAQCLNPFSCPHGRPTFIKYSKYDIEKRFKRV